VFACSSVSGFDFELNSAIRLGGIRHSSTRFRELILGAKIRYFRAVYASRRRARGGRIFWPRLGRFGGISAALGVRRR
jgi:hypothetical protein